MVNLAAERHNDILSCHNLDSKKLQHGITTQFITTKTSYNKSTTEVFLFS